MYTETTIILINTARSSRAEIKGTSLSKPVFGRDSTVKELTGSRGARMFLAKLRERIGLEKEGPGL